LGTAPARPLDRRRPAAGCAEPIFLSNPRKLYWSLGLAALGILVASILAPGRTIHPADLPWHIEHPAPGETRVFGLTLGRNTVAEAERRFGEAAVISLFRSATGELVAEAFFEQVRLADLRASIVVVIRVPAAELASMLDRAARIAATPGGRKATPAAEDADRLRTLPIAALTYLPAVRPDAAALRQRFGPPASLIRDRQGDIEHWLYPERGLAIAYAAGQKPVMQYVAPPEFDRLRAPLTTTDTPPAAK
jgi:hypothetical protein